MRAIIFLFLAFVIAAMFFWTLFVIKSKIKTFVEPQKEPPKIIKPKEKRVKTNFELFVDNYIKNKMSSSENVRVLQFISRDMMKSKEYSDQLFKFNVMTIFYLIIIIAGTIFSVFMGDLVLNGDSYVVNFCTGIVDIFLFFMLLNRLKHKKYNIFCKIPLSENQVQKVVKLNVEGAVKDYILEKSGKNHGLNGADLIFLTSMV